MRPKKLTMVGFGAFPNRAEIDFTIPGEANLFLITGPTGAGKSTIFDAMCYALFGTEDKSPGRKSVDMYSHYLKNSGKDAYVELEFGLGLLTYYIKRELPVTVHGKQRPGKNILRILDDSGSDTCTPITKVSEINGKIREVLGMTTEQFRQIVLLPQGDFQKFLLSKSSDREEILGKLFQTGLYEQITDQLKQLAKKEQDRYNQLRSERDGLLSGKEVNSADGLQILITGLTTQLQVLEQQLPNAKAAFDEATTLLQNARVLDTALAEYRQLQRAIEAHDMQKERIEKEEMQYKAAQQAEVFRDKFEQLNSLKALLAEDEQTLSKLRGELAGCGKLVIAEQDNSKELSAMKDEIERNRQEAESCRKLIPKFAEIDKAESESRKLQQSIDSAQEKLHNLSNKSKIDIEGLAVKNGRFKLLQEQANTKPGVEHRIEYLAQAKRYAEAILENRSKQQKIETDLQKRMFEYTRLSDSAGAAHEKHQKLEMQWRNSQAALLAITLKEGMPCPVCGSTEHPVPASSTEETVATEEVDQSYKELTKLQQQAEDARKAYNDIQTEQTALSRSLEQMESMLPAELPADIKQIEQLLAQERAKKSELERNEKQCLELQKQITDLQTAIDSDRIETQTLHNALSELQAASGTQAGKLAALRADIPADISDSGQLQERVDLLMKKVTQYDNKLTESQNSLQTAQLKYGKLQTQIEEKETQAEVKKAEQQKMLALINTAVTEAGFGGFAEVTEALRSKEVRESLERHIRDWKDSRVALLSQFQKIERDISGKEPPDLPRLTSNKDACESVFNTVIRDRASVQERLDDVQKINKRLEALEKSVLSVSHKAAAYDELHKVASGVNEKKQTLQTFILRAYLEDVLEASNKRLEKLSSGRYELRVREEISGNGKKGLELDIFDNYTGEQRPANTLSGGEMFLTSLALALGLADVVTMHSGAVKLDAMFIDEGFGSLDEQTLETAIEALKNLQQDGRMVGIISHVSELKERIPVKLEVVKDRRGSSLRWIV